MTFPGLYAMMAVAHMHRYGTTREQLAMVAVKNHANGSKNPLAAVPDEGHGRAGAQLGRWWPTRCTSSTARRSRDGAAAVILCPVEMARAWKKAALGVAGAGHASDTIALHSRAGTCAWMAIDQGGGQGLQMAGKTPEDIQVCEVHDCFTIAEIMVTEALGFVEKGKGGPAVQAGETALGGRIPVNPSGGLKSKGHPVGATGVAQVVEIVEQLRGEVGRAAGQGRPRGHDPEHGRHRRELRRPHPGGDGGSHAAPSSSWREIPERYRYEAGRLQEVRLHRLPAAPGLSAVPVASSRTDRLADTGKIVTYTVIRVPPRPFADQAPYALGIVELDDGVRLTAQVVDCEFEDLKIGKRVKLQFRRISEEGEAGVIHYGYKFVPE